MRRYGSRFRISSEAMKRGLLFIVTAPSGAGKSTILDRLLEIFPGMEYSISMTTRPPRKGETDGVDYFFVTGKEFEDKIADGEFLEYATVYDNYYGTRKAFIESRLDAGKDIILDIDVQGALDVKKKGYPAVYIYIIPPTMAELRKRLEGRKTDSREVVEKRLSKAAEETGFYGEYDYVVVNDDLDGAVDAMRAIVVAEKCRPSGIGDAIERFLGK